jgi:hypothetical protein
MASSSLARTSLAEGRRYLEQLAPYAPDTGELDYPNKAREIQHRIAAARAV